MENNKILSVIIFTYNHEKYIEQTILSVVNQKTKYDYEIVVNDDYSTDRTYQIIQTVQSKYPDLIQIIHNEENLGLNASFENAIRTVNSKYIALLGGDDYWITTDKIEKQLNILQSDDTINYVHTSYKMLIEKSGKIIHNVNKGWKWPLPKDVSKLENVSVVLTNNTWKYPLASTCCFRKDVLIKGLNEFPWILSFPLIGEGTILHLSMCLFGGQYAFMEEDTTIYRVIDGSLSHKTTKSEIYSHYEKFAILRYTICESLSYCEDKQRRIKKTILDNLFISAIINNQKQQYIKTLNSLTSLPFEDKNIFLKKCNLFLLHRLQYYVKYTKSVCKPIYNYIINT
jgi:glycosyltransferase involved in cell wall biosynthesis